MYLLVVRLARVHINITNTQFGNKTVNAWKNQCIHCPLDGPPLQFASNGHEFSPKHLKHAKN